MTAVVRKLETFRGQVLLIAPLWKAQPWCQHLLFWCPSLLPFNRLAACLITSLSPAVSSDVIKGSRDSTLRQYKRRAAPNVTIYAAALVDPLSLGFNITIRGRVLNLMKKGYFHQRPPVKRPRIFWSLSKVLTLLRGPPFTNPTPQQNLRKALFLVAMASGLRASQLHALIRDPVLAGLLQGWATGLPCTFSQVLGQE
ncbi:hypothetical protein E2C01_089685 [Portunus trituberculatus]|uniref:Uncharacterized protein n=1 Tax=Portunus trituberculatus TaxID=210409 RepID=A0A5B7JE80_PORTR|nr:hypothetical protein [Portunus trituberculatus]